MKTQEEIDASFHALPWKDLEVPDEYISKSPIKTTPGTMLHFDFTRMEWFAKWNFPAGFKFLEFVAFYMYPDCIVEGSFNHETQSHELKIWKKIRAVDDPPLAGLTIKHNPKED